MPNTTTNETLLKVTAALAPTEEILRAEFERQLIAQFDKMVAQLEADGMDAEISFFYPNARQMTNFYDKGAYRQQLASRNYVQANTGSANTSGCRGMRDPDIRTVDREATLVKIAGQAAKMAKEALEGYCHKLTSKIESTGSGIGEVKYVGGTDAWGWSHLHVEAETGNQTWRTQMIVNVSCLGKLFNQWPTRLVK